MEKPTNIEAQLPDNINEPLHCDLPPPPQSLPRVDNPLRKIILVASIALGVQFGWALQLSLLSPYVDLLSIPHTWAGYIWLCGPIFGALVQLIVGYYSDRCTSGFGRRRPFIAAGVGLSVVATLLIGYASDLGHFSNDPSRITPNIGYFVVGFMILYMASNMLQLACRALLADLAANQSQTFTANAITSFFMAVGNALGYAADKFPHLYLIFPFSRTPSCDVYCANLKSCFFISIALLIALTSLALSFVTEKTFIPSMGVNDHVNYDGGAPPKCVSLPFLEEIIKVLKASLKRPMLILLLVTCLNWIALFPFILYDLEWLGKDVYGGKVGQPRFGRGVKDGALGLMFNSVVMGVASLLIRPLMRWVGGAKRLWGIANTILAIGLAMMVLVTKMAQHARHQAQLGGAVEVPMPSGNIKGCALALFSLLGIPQSITFSVPYALASIYSASSDAGQGISVGVLSLAIYIPQIFVGVTSVPWDALFGGGNLPSLVVGAVVATTSSILCFTILPSLPPQPMIGGGTSRASTR